MSLRYLNKWLTLDFDSEGISSPRGQRGYFGVLLHHPDPASVQIDQTQSRTENPDPHVQSIGQRVGPARLLPGAGHRRLRQSRLLR